MRRLCLALLVAALVARTASNAQDPGNANLSELEASARAFIDRLVARDFAAAENSFDEAMSKALPREKLEAAWNEAIAQAGVLKRQGSARTEPRGEYIIVIVSCEFERSSIDVRVVFNRARQIAGLHFLPGATSTTYTPPSYVKPDTFRETEVVVGVGEWALPGSLALPKGQRSAPALILVHGSGPHDRDETIGPNKPFRDLAWGLASQGIAVLRYEKRTKQHGAKMGALKGLTVKEEAIDDVVAAVALLRKTKGVDGERIFVLGHSLGGTLVPRIGKRERRIAGFVVLAGAVKALEDSILEQTVYLFSLDGTMTDSEKEMLNELKQQVVKIKSLKRSDIDSAPDFYGAPASYLFDLRGYNPTRDARALRQPMLILQGERDYQVTMDDFASWRAALSSQRNVSFKSYPKLNHLFIEGSGASSPAEYSVPGHVAEVVVNDIAGWVKRWSRKEK